MTNEEQRIAKIVHEAVEAAVNAKLAEIHEQIRTHGMTTEERRYLDLAIQREARRERLQTAVIEKSTIGLVWFLLSVIALAVWKSFVSHVKIS
jgi:hypothetical protein